MKASSAEALSRMRSIRRRNTSPEIRIRRLLHRRGLRFFVERRPEPAVRRTADIIFPRRRVAIFVDGCFWHACPQHATWPKSNAKFWKDKLLTNTRRDEDTNAKLVEAGWTVIRVWEHVDPDRAARRISSVVRVRGKPRPRVVRVD